MRSKSPLGLAILGLFATGSAHSVQLSPSGLGEVLVYPYFTVNNGNNTLLTIGNSTSEGKALRVRFRESYNGREILSFSVYLSPYDIWTAAITDTGVGGGGAAITTYDNSCTVPTFVGTTVPFRNFAYSGANNDHGPEDLTRTREGYIEVIELGSVTNATQHTLDAITHVDSVPKDCSQLIAAWTPPNGYWTVDSSVDMAAPDGGLYGTATIVNVPAGTVEAYDADALAQFYAPGTPPKQLHTAPGTATPDLSSGTSLTSVTYPGDVPVMATFTRAIDAVSSLYMTDKLSNEYWDEPVIGAISEWVVTYPTKRFYTDPELLSSNAAATHPFDELFANPGTSCSPVIGTVFDREEDTGGAIHIDPPPPPPVGSLCYAAQVVTFQPANIAPTQVLGSTLVGQFNASFANGWGMIDFTSNQHTLTSKEGKVFSGQPATGFRVTEFVNGDLSGVRANYTALYRHHTHATCTMGSPAQPCP